MRRIFSEQRKTLKKVVGSALTIRQLYFELQCLRQQLLSMNEEEIELIE